MIPLAEASNNVEQSMNSFCVAALHMPPGLRARQGVVRSDAFFITDDAGLAAQHLLATARAQADGILAHARAEADSAVRREQERVAEEAGRMLALLQQMQDGVLDEAAGLAIELARRIFDRLVLDTTPQERLEAACRRVLEEAPPKLNAAVAWMHPDDAAGIDGTAGLPWEIKGDKRLQPGTCRLEASNGEWRAEFGLASEALRASLAQFIPAAPAPDANDLVAVGEDFGQAGALEADTDAIDGDES
ncbi:FliH/SctL family protein [Herbaspirillum sp. SJZ099]|uniref:FliH/SctL family protein n=2 Tax=Herbaspirillum TaxID=963 RepID=UPI001154E5C3|nr:FliH/SctL family protein [Herbaspirillum sp. SJZ099]MBB5391343.1 hypothetical protein [Herbaspirillum sp. SJZ102]TQK12970.1 flagellar biosynthesis/type III secretory pathway protein FliH [Herbaspirillum sp. SJZ130]TQK14974.1 flagellar biosynthesis/type III secretory pathway protein FliH [Herbaspirillum sp. SJZ106]TWC67329.1 flagellar biosynthesis/type III secretory pathway protein FliH [Herbaspirillum sp. SJZ099]